MKLNHNKKYKIMSEGKLCEATIFISDDINSESKRVVCCDLYQGHEGEHSKMFYHCADRPNDAIFKDNHRLGRISWKGELSSSFSRTDFEYLRLADTIFNPTTNGF